MLRNTRSKLMRINISLEVMIKFKIFIFRYFNWQTNLKSMFGALSVK